MIADDIDTLDQFRELVERIVQEQGLVEGYGVQIPNMNGTIAPSGTSVVQEGRDLTYYGKDVWRETSNPIWRGSDANRLLYLVLHTLVFHKARLDLGPGSDIVDCWRETVQRMLSIEPSWREELLSEYRGYWEEQHGNKPFPLDSEFRLQPPQVPPSRPPT